MKAGSQHFQEIPRKPLSFFIYVSKPFRFWAVTASLVVIVAASLGQGSSYLFKLIVDAVGNNDYQQAFLWGLSYPLIVFVGQTLWRVSGYLAMRWTIGAEKQSSDILMSYLLKHSNSYYGNRFAGSILSKVGNVSNASNELAPEFLWTYLEVAITFLVTVILMFMVDPVVALLFLSLLLVLLGTNSLFTSEKHRLSKENAEANTILKGKMVDIFSNISAVRQYVNNEHEYNAVKELTNNRLQTHWKTWMNTEKMLLLNGFVLFLFAAAMFGWLTHRWSLGQVTAGDFVLVLSLVSQITGTLLMFGRSINNTARMLGEMQEGLDDILVPHEIVDNEGAERLRVEKGKIDWKDVTFEYGKNKVFDDFNLSILDGERVGLVGPSGAGKTTFVSLLLRQHDLGSGEISIDGQNIAEVTQDSLREHISIVPQEPLLFHRSIRENIAYGKPEATDEEIMTVARLAQAHDFIRDLSEGYNTLVGERGVKLSGGQKQRVAIARAMLKDAPILVLDEATSALDSESEVAIQKALHKLMEGKTVIAIAHRLSTLREMDRIIVLEGGKIVEDGTHDSLLTHKGVYARLWEHQAGGFLQE